ncbi:MAG: lytic transglycosylase domain-containing protein [Cocleimonas sp.]|nr:lytic transglycosylase domain-containing protein [Cocleimonas sp.]
MKIINTIVAIIFTFSLTNFAMAEPYQQLAMLDKNASAIKKGKVKPRRKRSRWSCLSNIEIIKRKALKIDHIIIRSSRKYSVDSNLIRAVIAVESCYDSRAVSPAGAQGLMQLIPATADRFGVSDSFDIAQNINAGTKYLRFLLKRYDGDLRKATAGYNAGEGKVDRYNGIPPYKETRNYVKNVLRIFGELSGNPELSSLIIGDTLVNKNPIHYKGMSAADKAILSRIQSLGVKSSFSTSTKRKKPKHTFVNKGVNSYKGMSTKKRAALQRVRALQIKSSYKKSRPAVRQKKSLHRVATLRKILITKRLESKARALSAKPGRQGWNYNRQLAPHLYKVTPRK